MNSERLSSPLLRLHHHPLKGSYYCLLHPHHQQLYLFFQHCLNLLDLNSVERIDITVDGADEVDNNKNLLKGGGGALTREKIVAHYSKRYLIVITEEKLVVNLGSRMPIPIEVLPFSYVQIIRELDQMGLSCQLRKNFTTDNGNYIIDCKPNQKVLKGSLQDLNKAIKLIPGVVETGIFINFNPEILYHKNGQVLEIK